MSSSRSSTAADEALLFHFVTAVMEDLDLIETLDQNQIQHEREFITEYARHTQGLHLDSNAEDRREQAANFALNLRSIGYRPTVVSSSALPPSRPSSTPHGLAIAPSDTSAIPHTSNRPGYIHIPPGQDPREWVNQRGLTDVHMLQPPHPQGRHTFGGSTPRPESRASTSTAPTGQHRRPQIRTRAPSRGGLNTRGPKRGEESDHRRRVAPQESEIVEQPQILPRPQWPYAQYGLEGYMLNPPPAAFPIAPQDITYQGPVHLGMTPFNPGMHYYAAPGLPPTREEIGFGLPPRPPRSEQRMGFSNGPYSHGSNSQSNLGARQARGEDQDKNLTEWQKRQKKKEEKRITRADYTGDHASHTNWNLGEKDEILKQLGLWVRTGEEHLNRDKSVNQFSRDNRIYQRSQARDQHSMISKRVNGALDSIHGVPVREEFRRMQACTWPKALFRSHANHIRPALREAIAWYDDVRNGRAPVQRPSDRVLEESRDRQHAAGFTPGEKKRKRAADAETSGRTVPRAGKKRKRAASPPQPTPPVAAAADQQLRLRLVGAARQDEEAGEEEQRVEGTGEEGDAGEEGLDEEFVEDDEIIRQLEQLEEDRKEKER